MTGSTAPVFGNASLPADGDAHLRGLEGVLRERVRAAADLVTAARLAELVSGLVDLPSPTGDERPVAEHLVDRLSGAGLAAELMPLDDRQANAWGRLPGDGTGPSLMLYAPTDTVTTGDPAEDLPWIGAMRPDLQPCAEVRGDYVIGLGASNPKGHAACVLAAVEAIAAAGIPLHGDLVAAFGAGGMPTNARPGVDNPRLTTGQGAGCSFLLEQGVHTDYAVIAKPGWTVAWDEVGLTWFEIVVHGTHTYTGSRHRLPYRNTVRLAAEVVCRLEDWLPSYTARHTGGQVAPQGMVANIHGGWTRTASFTPENVRLMVDLRISPRSTPSEVRRELEAEVARIAAELGTTVDVRPVLAIPGVASDPDSWFVRRAVGAWEAVTGREHPRTDNGSGATDAAILRSRGIPTVRIGMPKITDAPFPVDFAMGMNAVDLREAAAFTRFLIRFALEVASSDLDTAEVH